MVKLRGINIWPEAIGEIVNENSKVNGEYFCYVELVTNREEMTVLVEQKYASTDSYALQIELEELLKKRVGVKIHVKVVEEDSLRELTGHGSRAKLVRFEDRR